MRRLFTYIILIIAALNAFSQNWGGNIILNQPIVGGAHTYEASHTVQLQPGFQYRPQTTGDFFKALVNKPTQVLPPTAGEKGGPEGMDEIVGEDGVVGATAGIFAVSETGQATYVVPLEFPGGIGGMTPELSLVYNSNGGDGILGPGWSLGGLSVIELVPANRYHDGILDASKGLDYLEDTYTLDGKRLIKVYDDGDNNLKFRTEQDEFSLIERKKTLEKDEPGFYFVVKKKSGLTYFYGQKNKDSRLQSRIDNKNRVVAYYVDKIEDVFGNTIEFIYNTTLGNVTNNNPGEIYIDKIRYTANGDIGPAYEIQFNYLGRNSPKLTYYNYKPSNNQAQQISFQNNKLISSIECKYLPNNVIVKSYSLDYINRGPGTNNANKTKHLASIQEFGYNKEQKYNKTVFEWEDEMDYSSFELLTYSLPEKIFWDGIAPGFKYSSRNFQIQLADVDDDGVSEVVRTYEYIITKINGGWNTKDNITHEIIVEVLKRGSSSEFEHDFFIRVPYQSYLKYWDEPISYSSFSISFSDYNGDGKNDILARQWRYNSNSMPLGTDLKLYLKNEDGSFNSDNLLEYYHVGYNLYEYVSDINGDGIADLTLHDQRSTVDGSLFFRLGDPLQPLDNSSDKFNGVSLNYSMDTKIQQPMRWLDYNGDGRSDIIIQKPNNQAEIRRITFNANGTLNINNVVTLTDYDVRISQFAFLNTDRKLDIIKQNDFNTECFNDNCSKFNMNLSFNARQGYGIAGFGATDIIEIGGESFDFSYDNWFDGSGGYVTRVYITDFNGDGQREYKIFCVNTNF